MNIVKSLIIIQLFACYGIIAEHENIKSKTSKTEIERGVALNAILTQELKQLNKISSMIQYLASSANKGNINIKNNDIFRDWIFSIQENIRIIEKSYSLPINKEQLNYIATCTKELTKNLVEALTENCAQLEEFKLPVYRNNMYASKEAINNKIQDNAASINHLEKLTYEIGLTNLNKVTRKIDKFIDDSNLITPLKRMIPATCISALALFFTPEEIVPEYLLPLKKNKIIGSFDYKAKDMTVLEALFSREGIIPLIEPISKTVLILSLLLTKSDSIPYLGTVKSMTRSWWNKCKGFGYEDKGTNAYQVIDNLTLDDECLVGLESQVEELKKLVLYVTNPEMYDRSGSNLEKGILLVGPSRNGKTYLAKALSGSINKELKKAGRHSNMKFKELKYREIEWNSEGIKKEIEKAKRDAPCIIFFDEIHTLHLQVKEGSDVLQTFLTGMSGINDEADFKHQVIFLAATNQPWLLDSALIQSGRFGKVITVETPLLENRKKYLEIILKQNSINTTNINLELLAEQTEGCSYGDLATIIKAAKFDAQSTAKGVSQEHLQNAINSKVFRLKNNCPLTTLEKKHLSTHQAGHALMHMKLEPQEKLLFTSINGRWRKIKETRFWDNKLQKRTSEGKNIKYGITATYQPAESINIESYDEKIKKAKIKLAGPLAEQILLGSAGYSVNTDELKRTFHGNDKAKALEYLKIIVYNGLKKEDLPKSIVKDLDLEAYNLLKKCEQEVLKTLTQDHAILEKIAQELEANSTLTSSQLGKIINTK